jgi:hypothetical protein
VGEHQISADALAAGSAQLAITEAGKHDGAAKMPGSRGNPTVERAGGLDLVAPAECLDDVLNMKPQYSEGLKSN